MTRMPSPKAPFDLAELAGTDTGSAVRRCEAAGFVVQVIDLERPEFLTMEWRSDRIRVSVRGDHVVRAEHG